MDPVIFIIMDPGPEADFIFYHTAAALEPRRAEDDVSLARGG